MAGEPPKVFVNFPFDDAYEPVLRALVLAISFAGFIPTSALTSGDVGRPRIDRILDELGGAAFSVHDLSRCRGAGDENLTRMNMPLELGIALHLAHTGDHRWMALVPDGPDHRAYVSDLAGYDLESYGGDGDRRRVVHNVVVWLRSVGGADVSPISPRMVTDALPRYEAALEQARNDWPLGVPWLERVDRAAATVEVAAAAPD